MSKKGRPKESIEDKIEKIDDCWIWTRGTHRQGYPMARDPRNLKRMILVSRYYMELKLNRTLAKSERVKNRCGNALCVNPDHYIVAQPGTEDWKCVTWRYPPNEVDAWMKEYFDGDNYHGKGTKIFNNARKKYPKLTSKTFWDYIRKYKEKHLTQSSK